MKISVPKKLVAGLYVMVRPSVVAVPPLFVAPTAVMVSVSTVSGDIESFASTSNLLSVQSSFTVQVSLFAVGGSLKPFTVTRTVAVSSELGVPSLMV